MPAAAVCPICGVHRANGHLFGCELAEVLAAVRLHGERTTANLDKMLRTLLQPGDELTCVARRSGQIRVSAFRKAEPFVDEIHVHVAVPS